jgi:hypothetical protein
MSLASICILSCDGMRNPSLSSWLMSCHMKQAGLIAISTTAVEVIISLLLVAAVGLGGSQGDWGDTLWQSLGGWWCLTLQCNSGLSRDEEGEQGGVSRS